MAAFKAFGELAGCLVLGRKCAALSFNCLLRYNVEVAGGNLAAQVDGAWYDDQFLEVTNVLGSAPALRSACQHGQSSRWAIAGIKPTS